MLLFCLCCDDLSLSCHCLQLVYRPLAALIRRIFQHPVLARWATYHAEQPRSAAHDLCDFQDGSVYAHDIMGDPHFAAEPRNLAAALVTDGMQPYKDDRKYSMWPLVVTFYNFPPHIRYMLAITSLLCVIPGSRLDSSRLDLQPTLQIVKDEFKLLQHGIQLMDAHRQEQFTCRAKLVQVCAITGNGCGCHGTSTTTAVRTGSGVTAHGVPFPVPLNDRHAITVNPSPAGAHKHSLVQTFMSHILQGSLCRVPLSYCYTGWV